MQKCNKVNRKKSEGNFRDFFCLCLFVFVRKRKKYLTIKKRWKKIYTKKNIVTKKRGLIYRVISEKKFTGLKKSEFFFLKIIKKVL